MQTSSSPIDGSESQQLINTSHTKEETERQTSETRRISRDFFETYGEGSSERIARVIVEEVLGRVSVVVVNGSGGVARRRMMAGEEVNNSGNDMVQDETASALPRIEESQTQTTPSISRSVTRLDGEIDGSNRVGVLRARGRSVDHERFSRPPRMWGGFNVGSAPNQRTYAAPFG